MNKIILNIQQNIQSRFKIMNLNSCQVMYKTQTKVVEKQKIKKMEDDQVVKQLMSMLGSNRQLKFRSASGKLLKLSLDRQDSKMKNSREKLQFRNNFENELSLSNIKNNTKEEQDCKKFQQILQQAGNVSDRQYKNILKQQTIVQNSSTKYVGKNTEQAPKKQTIISSDKIQTPIALQPNKNNVSSNGQKKVSLLNKNKGRSSATNEAVLNFLDCKKKNESTRNQTIITSSQSIKNIDQPLSFPIPKAQTNKQTEAVKENNYSIEKIEVPSINMQSNSSNSQLSLSNSMKKPQQISYKSNNSYSNNSINNNKQLASQSIKFLKEHHPEDSQYLSIIEKRMTELQQVQKSKIKLDEEISSIFQKSFSINSNSNSFINGGISFKYDNSFDASMISLSALSVTNANDPLCQIFLNYMKRNRPGHKHQQIKKPSFLFMYSQPMIDIKGIGIDNQVDYFSQENQIQKIVKECRINYIREQATLEKLNYWLAQEVSILHYCGHGEPDHLLFEGPAGTTVKLDEYKLENILKKQATPLQLVFVASCHSEETGKIFKQAGAVHVICVKKDFQILDEVCKEFSRIFYHSCINNRMKICEAFSFTKKQLQLCQKFTKHQCSKFILFTHNNHTEENCPSKLNILNEKNQEFQNLTQKPFYHKKIPARVENFIPRPYDLHLILKILDTKNRFINIIGSSGIGKSTLVRELVRYVQFRNLFKDGVIYLDIRSCDKIIKLFEVLSIQLFESSSVSVKLNKTFGENTQKIVKELYDKEVIIVLDNCQNIILSDQKAEFKKFIETIMKNCNNVYFVFTSRNSIGRQIDYCSQKIYELGKLTNSQAETLFFQRVPRNIDHKQMEQFFRIQGVKDFSKHPFFEFLNGHPEAICMTASLLCERSLNQLYDLLMKPLVKQLPKQKLEEEGFGINPLVETAMKISLNVLKNKHKQAAQMLKTLSLLPVGIDSQTMAKLFGKQWQEIVQKLIHHSLVHHRANYYSVHPNIIIYVESQISQEQKIRIHEKISDEFLKRIERIYKYIGTLSPSSQKAQEQFLAEQQNYKAMIFREISFFGNKTRIRKLYSNLFQPDFSEQQEQKLQDFIKTHAVEGIHKKRVYSQKIMQPTKKQSIQMIVVYYVTILFVMKSPMFLTYVDYGIFISRKKKKEVVQANLLRLKACLFMIRNKLLEAKDYFLQSWELYAIQGCGLGSASCQGAIGYIRMIQQQYAPAKKHMENALKYYNEINHPFGKHYLNRWLCTLKTKMNRTQKQLISHRQQAQKLLKQAKMSLKSSTIHNASLTKHKLGWFVFRFTFDNISLFMEASFDLDLKPKIINQTFTKRPVMEGQTKFLEDFGDKQIQVFSSLHKNQIHKRAAHKPKVIPKQQK